jgi:transcriptional regulator with XRE-family HTH domain
MENSFGKFLKKAREQKKISMNSLAKKCGLSGAYISNLEAGIRTMPSVNVIMKFSEVLNVTFEELMFHAGYLRDQDTVYKEMIAQFRKAIEESKVIDISNLEGYQFKLDGRVLDFQDAQLVAQMIQMLIARQSAKDEIPPSDSN